MSYLFPIPLRGVGTADVEAFGTYLHRLARAHGISTGRFLTHIQSWHAAVRPDRQFNLAGILSSPDVCVFVRPNQTTEQLVDIISYATGMTDLRCGTFLALKQALDRSMNTFATRLRWCPVCMSEFEALGDPGYFKLIWQLHAISHCPIHLLPLKNKCPVCRSYQSGFRARNDCTSCMKCGCPLSNERDVDGRADSWQARGSDLIDLVESIAGTTTLVYPAGGVRSVLTKIFDQVWSEVHELRFWKLIPRDECLGIVMGDQPVTLTTARRVAYYLGMRLPDLLAGTVSMTSEVLDPTWTNVLPDEMRPRKRRAPRDKTKVLDAVVSMLSQEKFQNSPPALEVVASHIGVSVGYLHYHFPMIAGEVLRKHKHWVDDERRRKQLQARSAALSFINHDRYKYEKKSRKNALRVLRTETGLSKNILRAEIWAVFRDKLKQ